MATPRRGEVWLIDFGMAGKTRPALVVSGAFGDQDRALITVIPHTTSLLGSVFDIIVPVSFLKPALFSSRVYRRFPRFALSAASVLFHRRLLPKFLMHYCAGWGSRRNPDGTAPPVLEIHLLGRKTVLRADIVRA
jgi:hypothetical protein